MMKLPKSVTASEYAAAFKSMIKSGVSLEELNLANHAGLENGLISMDYFQAAAQVLVKEIMNR